jgi:Type IV secretion-system coupling protein DNA-binding domain
MSVIDERAMARRVALRNELRAKYPTLLREPADATAIVVGKDPKGALVRLPERPRREHMHCLGTTGGGKSKFLMHTLLQDTALGYGVCVLDPHGGHPDSVYRSTLTALDQLGMTSKRIVHLIDPDAPNHTLGFNPLARPDAQTDLSVLAGLVLEAFSQAWGGEDTSAKPTIERVLTVTFTALAELGLTLVEAPLLLYREDPQGLRRFALSQLKDEYARTELRRLHELSVDKRRVHDYDLEVLGPLNRLARLVRPPAIRAMLGQTDRLLDFRKAFDEGHIILCNLSGGARVYEKDADLLGRLLTRFLFFHAKRRTRPDRPFFVYIDECHRLLSGDVENILAESRKYGMAVVLANQWLAQAEAQSENMLAAIRNATNCKVIFRIKDPEEAEDLAHTVVPLDLEIPVHTLTRPTVVGHRRIRLDSESVGSQSSRTITRGTSIGETDASGTSVARTTGESASEGVARGLSRATHRAEGTTTSTATGESISEGFSSGTSWGESSAIGESAGTVTSAATGISSGAVLTPTDPTAFIQPEPIILSESLGESSMASNATASGTSAMHGTSSAQSESQSSSFGSFTSTSAAKSKMRGESNAMSDSRSVSVGRSSSVSRAQSAVRAHSRAHSESEGEATGESRSRGSSEALEPILEERPASVHSKQNVLYLAAQMLRNLKTGSAFLNYVGAHGMIATPFVVPHVRDYQLSDNAFKKLRDRILSKSPSAIPALLASERVEQRQNMFRTFTSKETQDSAEPKSFRVAARPNAACRASSRPVAARRGVSRTVVEEHGASEETPSTDGGQEQATHALGQGSRSPEATAQSAALDGARVRPKKARHAVDGKVRIPF